LVLDEATSFIDVETTALIMNFIKNKIKRCTILAIVHRLANVADFDKVVFMKDGKILESGRPFELLVNVAS
jgi:ATP-binding cassette subfamily C (CFTR/MRP) protein 1